ncbi:MAG: ATPase [Rhodospirillales bacterium]|nr:ATPase [Rhodospirillales bacterium]
MTSDKPSFVYVTYIKSTRERVWQALTDNAMIPDYWFGHRIESDWKVGAPLKFYDGDQLVHDDRVLAYNPPSVLSYSWRPLRKGFEGEAESRVTFTLEETGAHVKLTMVHDQMQPGGKMLGAVSGGWPAVLSSLKSLLETGAALDGLRPPPSRAE